MKIKNEQLEMIMNAINDIDASGGAPAKLAYVLAKAAIVISPHLEAVAKVRNAVITKYSPETGVLSPKCDGYVAAIDELKPIMEDLVDIKLPDIEERDLLKLEKIIKVSSIVALLPLVKD